MISTVIYDALNAAGYDAGFSDPARTRVINEMLTYVYGMRRWRFLEQESTALTATVANQGIVSIAGLGAGAPAGVKIDAVRLAFGTDYRGDDDMDEVTNPIGIKNLRHVYREAGFPYKWGRIADSIYFWPIPNATYPLAITYYTQGTLIASQGDVISFPQEHSEVIIQGVIYHMAQRQRDWPAYDRALAAYDKALANMQRDESVVSRQSSDEVERWSGWDRLT